MSSTSHSAHRSRPRAKAAGSRVRYVDSHTEGEPTRVVVAGGPTLATGGMADRRIQFVREHNAFRRLVIDPPRGSSECVGALLVPPRGPSTFGAIFFNNVGALGMCGHGTIGVAVTLAHLREVPVPGRFDLDTPVGPVPVELHSEREASFTNVPSFRSRKAVRVDVPGLGPITGDVAWGGNWFFIVEVEEGPFQPADIGRLTEQTEAIRRALSERGITGEDGSPVDHIELCGPPSGRDSDARNFVLCPGGAYDRSPCGTGTSAKMACLYADGSLEDGDVWRQEGIIGTRFVGTAHVRNGRFTPTVRGHAYITGEGELVADPNDPLLPRS